MTSLSNFARLWHACRARNAPGTGCDENRSRQPSDELHPAFERRCIRRGIAFLVGLKALLPELQTILPARHLTNRINYTKYVNCVIREAIRLIRRSLNPALADAASSTDPRPYRPPRDPLRFIGVPSRYITRSMKYCPSESVRDSSM